MKPKLLLWLALVLGGGFICCSASSTTILAYSNRDSPGVVECPIRDLGRSFSIRVSAKSWPALVRKVKPTFAWNGCDMMWIEEGTKVQQRFILDEAYVYQPTNQPRQWVLLNDERANRPINDLHQEYPRFFYSDRNLRAVATLQASIPPIQNDAGERGNYAVVIASNQHFGTVCEIGWQREMGCGTGHPEYGRRIYLWRDRLNHWHFLGEGPEEGWARGGGCEVKSKVIWENSRTNNLPFQIQFHSEEITMPYNTSADDTNPPPDVTICYDTALVAELPAPCQEIGKNPYLLAEKEDTLDKIIYRLGYYFPGWEGWPDKSEQQARNKRTLEAWHSAIMRLNPELPPSAIIKEGTRVNLPEPGEIINHLYAVERQMNAKRQTRNEN